jgi:dienelactone hydrolase
MGRDPLSISDGLLDRATENDLLLLSSSTDSERKPMNLYPSPHPRHAILLVTILVTLTVTLVCHAEDEWPAVPRRLPPEGVPLDPGDHSRLSGEFNAIQRGYMLLNQGDAPAHDNMADAEVFIKGVDLALQLGEFYADRDVRKARELLEEANRRLMGIGEDEQPWTRQTGLVVRGYYSRIDRSPQPYGLVIPENHDWEKPSPLYVWLHGRGDKVTDLHFIHQRMRQVGQIAPPNAIVLHPFGRHCLGFKSAGEIDVLEAIDHVRSQYRIDDNRIVLIGFSMGGAGAWHLGAHYADRWVAVSPGAGFSETAQYQRLRPENYPPSYEQTLWGVYDVPNYVRNLFNVPVFAYSGEHDRQIQAARVMEAAYAEHGRTLTHWIGPGVEHAYEPETLAKLLEKIDAAVQRGRDPLPLEVHLQTRTLRYSRQYWVEASGLEQHWHDSRIDARRSPEGNVTLTTRNVTHLRLWLEPSLLRNIEVDGQSLDVLNAERNDDYLALERQEEQWRTVARDPATETKEQPSLRKRPRQQGPIDDAFMEPFLVVTPRGPAANPQVEKWQAFELQHLRDRWQGVFRGVLPEKTDAQVTDEDVARCHLVLFGDPSSNRWIRKLLDEAGETFPLQWTAEELSLGPHQVSAEDHVPVMIFPSPFNSQKYVVINSGPTFRADHDRTNSLQNPKLPDWALLRIDQPPDGSSAGQVVAADFFDEMWRIKSR